MDTHLFETTLRGIRTLNDSEGPSRNVNEPKFQAAEQAQKLKEALETRLAAEWSLSGQEQLCRVILFLGNHNYEVEDDKEALRLLTLAFTLVVRCIEESEGTLADAMPTPLGDILTLDVSHFAGRVDFTFVATYIDVLNSLGVFLSHREEQQRVDDARKLLHLAESTYDSWNMWFMKQPFCCDVRELDFDAEGALVHIDGKDLQWRHRMEELYVTTLFCLAQAYSIKANVKLASKYCHLTMVRQLLCKKEFNKKDWATNALQLSSFYSTEECFGCALHCLDAGRHVMPSQPADEETLGVVAWAYGKYFKGRLRHYLERRQKGDTPATVARDDLGRAEWWVDFPLPIDPPQSQPHLLTFEDLRAEFIRANRYFNEAKRFYVMDGSCTDHIKLLQDQVEILGMLAAAEPDLERKIAMHMQRAAYLHDLPHALNPQAYTTLIRQLHFDLGDMYSDLFDLRLQQRRENAGRPFSDKQMNRLSERARQCFWDFLNTFKERGAVELPAKVENDLQVPFFRALMRIAGLETKRFHRTPQEEYESIGNAIERYRHVVRFYQANSGCHEELAAEVKLAEEMVALLPGKQREVMRHSRAPS